MAAAQEWKDRLESTKQSIIDVNAKILALAQAKQDAISMGDGAAAIKAKHDAKTLQETLEDLTILQAALEVKLRICKANEVKAEKVRGEIGAAWNQMAPLVDTIIQAQASVKQAYGEIAKIQGQIGSLAQKHSELVPEKFESPILRFAKEIIYFPNAALTPLSSWQYVSEEQRQAAAAKREAEEQEAQAARVKVAMANAPICPKCKQPMELRKEIGLDGERGVGSCQWSYTCRNCKIVTNKYLQQTDLRKR